ncbi:MAG: MBL fold metallo-hydrolase [Bacteroidetes bacterium]|nr:MBL fold metallo-hydrolase [Bacteroidota bacterium]MCL6100887.1 MBL fold metallo-hydrolase [Bacteroidota bacterium]
MIEICALASGSNGNCYYIGNNEDALLIDAGLSFKQILKRMEAKALDPKKIRAVFITHEHGDHVRGVRVLGKKLDIPVYMTNGTYAASFRTWKPVSYIAIENNIPVEMGLFKVYPILKNHDAAEPTSFRVEHRGYSIGVFTDIGTPCDNVKQHLKQCHALFLETNYDPQLLKEGPYPYYLKVRIDSAVGHLSNIQAFELLKEHAHPDLQCVFLSHLSAENNRPELAYNQFKSLEEKFLVKLTDRFAASELYTMA